jgi:hypothetical protein
LTRIWLFRRKSREERCLSRTPKVHLDPDRLCKSYIHRAPRRMYLCTEKLIASRKQRHAVCSISYPDGYTVI